MKQYSHHVFDQQFNQSNYYTKSFKNRIETRII